MRWFPFLLLLLGACGGPGEDTVTADFRREHPGAVVISAEPGEGDGDHVYYEILFRGPSDTTVREAVWGYRRIPDGSWQVFQRDVPKEPN